MQRDDLIAAAPDRFKMAVKGTNKQALLDGCIKEALVYYGDQDFQIALLQTEWTAPGNHMRMEVYFESAPEPLFTEAPARMDDPIDYTLFEKEK